LTLNESTIAYQQFVADRPNGADLTYFHVFPIALGAGEHCSLGAETQVFTDIFKWMSRIWEGYTFENLA
jgi:hypothetical protein